MANTDAPNGFQLIGNGGKHPLIRRSRIADGEVVAGGSAAALAPGDAYTLVTDGAIQRARRATSSDTVHGIMEACALATNSGPESYKYVPGNATGNDVEIIGIEDPDAEFEVQANETLFDDVGKYCDVNDFAPDTALGRSNQEASGINASPTGLNFRVVRLVNRPGVELGTDGRWVVRMLNAIG